MLVSREIICYRSADLYEVWSRINIDILTRLTATIGELRDRFPAGRDMPPGHGT